MSSVTFGSLVSRLSRYAGRSGVREDSQEARIFALEVLEEYLNSGGEAGGISKWVIKIQNNYFTLPNDLAVPLKIKAGCESGIVHSEWYEFFDSASKAECDSCSTDGLSFSLDVNYHPTVFDLPSCGAAVLVAGDALCPQPGTINPAPHVTIQGTSGGVDVWTNYKGTEIHGERLDIFPDKITSSRTIFDRITQVTISKTPGVKTLWSQVPGSDKLGFLASYDPNQTIGRFRRGVLSGAAGQNIVTILGRVRVKESYSDNDLVPITNMTAVVRLAKSRQAEENSNYTGAAFSMQRADKNINDANSYNRTGQDEPFDIISVTAPSGIHKSNSLVNYLRRKI